MTDDPTLDLLAIGEILVDFISIERAENLREASTFRRYLGGSPANIATNVSRLGRNAAVMGKTGIGAFGQFLKAELQHNGVITDYIVMDHLVHSSIIFVSRTSGTPDFEPSRDGDFKLAPNEVSEEAIAAAQVIHTSTWPISREPSRSAVFKAFQIAQAHNKIISFDPNYSPLVWPDYQEAQEVMRDLYRYTTITKASLDDSVRFFGKGYTPDQYIEMYHNLGPETVVLTMGGEGSIISQDGRILGHLPVRKIEVEDATGAGDSFWAGYLTALLDGHPPEICLLFAREVVELKLKTVGTLPVAIDRQALYDRLPNWDEEFNPHP